MSSDQPQVTSILPPSIIVSSISSIVDRQSSIVDRHSSIVQSSGNHRFARIVIFISSIVIYAARIVSCLTNAIDSVFSSIRQFALVVGCSFVCGPSSNGSIHLELLVSALKPHLVAPSPISHTVPRVKNGETQEIIASLVEAANEAEKVKRIQVLVVQETSPGFSDSFKKVKALHSLAGDNLVTSSVDADFVAKQLIEWLQSGAIVEAKADEELAVFPLTVAKNDTIEELARGVGWIRHDLEQAGMNVNEEKSKFLPAQSGEESSLHSRFLQQTVARMEDEGISAIAVSQLELDGPHQGQQEKTDYAQGKNGGETIFSERVVGSLAAFGFVSGEDPRASRFGPLLGAALKTAARTVPTSNHDKATRESIEKLIEWGSREGASKADLRIAVLSLISFGALLRPSEAVGIRRDSVAIKMGEEESLIIGVTVPKAKNDQEGKGRTTFFSLNFVRKEMKRACAEAGVTPFTPHCLRGGGATTSIEEGTPVEQVRMRGRWNSSLGIAPYLADSVKTQGGTLSL
ncbi:hypothetical protein PRIPAC_93483 [Pristionchus pacificus]|uniref:Uncharacterized protein n=1 Tax=Pristionchus pacificus TaxID=54126 RepID=A0A2A6CR44_PRIPA|nr:hypothetical protein PRIPAC_93483 [Pristionchus pacificus]|eukprot:PDM80513.1 hypothetical protein PRIPAC_35505 [Pristionchus pacificus]